MDGRMFDDLVSGLLMIGALMGAAGVVLLYGLWWLIQHVRVEWVG